MGRASDADRCEQDKWKRGSGYDFIFNEQSVQ